MKLENRFSVPVGVEEAWRVLLDVERIAPCMPGATLTEVAGDEFTGTVKVKVGPINLTYGGRASFVSKDDTARVVVIDGSGKETRGPGTAKALITCRLLDRGAATDVEVDTDLTVTGKPAQFGRGVLADVSTKLVDRFAACLAEEIRSGSPAEDSSSTGAEAASARASSAAGAPGTSARGAQNRGADIGDPAANGAATVTSTRPAPAPAPAPASAPAPAPASAPVSAPASGPAPGRRRPTESIDLLETAGLPVLKRVLPLLAAVGLVLLIVARRRRR